MKLLWNVAVLALAVSLALGAGGCKDTMDTNMLTKMGGIDGLTKFMSNWTTAMSADEMLSKSLSADDMNMISRGFTNEVAKVCEIPMPQGGVELAQVLKEKNLSKENLDAMGGALKAAAGTSQLPPDATKGAMGLWDGVVKTLK
jgi:hypothetical protein